MVLEVCGQVRRQLSGPESGGGGVDMMLDAVAAVLGGQLLLGRRVLADGAGRSRGPGLEGDGHTRI